MNGYQQELRRLVARRHNAEARLEEARGELRAYGAALVLAGVVTQAQLGRALGLSRERVRQWVEEAKEERPV